MRIGIAADHGGYELKAQVIEFLKKEGYPVKDYGAYQYEATDDYPDFIAPLARGVAGGEVDRGIALCGSGVGASIVANKIPGVRAALITETYSAHQGVEHDDMNVMCVGARVIGPMLIQELVRAFIGSSYTGEERHQRRLNKVLALENSSGTSPGASGS